MSTAKHWQPDGSTATMCGMVQPHPRILTHRVEDIGCGACRGYYAKEYGTCTECLHVHNQPNYCGDGVDDDTKNGVCVCDHVDKPTRKPAGMKLIKRLGAP